MCKAGRDIEATPYYPASSFGLPNVIAVTSTDSSDQLASWSNYGAQHINIAAPGVDILTTQPGGGYTTVTGTSASAPLVAGVAGLIKTLRPWMTAAGTSLAITSGARPMSHLSGKVSSGGIVSAYGALDALQGSGDGQNGSNPEPSPTPTPTMTAGGQSGNGNSGNTNGTPGTSPGGATNAPRLNLPNLDTIRNLKSSTQTAPAPIHADVLPLCDVDCGGVEPPINPNSPDPEFSTARTDPENATGQPGVNLGSRNFNWSLPLVNLRGRAGMDLSLGLYYNSLVWTKSEDGIMFNADRGFPGPGFQLGMPKIQRKYTDTHSNQLSYLLITSSGARVAMEQVGQPNFFESKDGSNIRMTDYGGSSSITLFMPDGTTLAFVSSVADEYRCTEIKDRNGNYIYILYNHQGRISQVTDTHF